MIETCEKLTQDVIKDTCEYQVNAIGEEDMKALLKAHLKQDHNDEFNSLGADEVAKIDQKVKELFAD